METTSLTQLAIFLAVAAIIAPLARRFGIGSALGYIFAGVLIGPYGVGLVYSLYEVQTIRHTAEFGVVLLLFLIGLELRPKRFWAMRQAVFGVGAAQVVITAVLLTGAGLLLELRPSIALFLGIALSLSSTALALQVLDEKGELRARHGRVGFSVLLFQDLAAIPAIAMVPLFAAASLADSEITPLGAVRLLGALAAIILVGRFMVARLYRLVALTGVREATTASALLTVVLVTMLMQWVGLSAALGAFIAGALLADSQYRHQIEADIAPFSGLLLGLFFVSIGMALNIDLLGNRTGDIFAAVAGLLTIKIAVLYALGRFYGLDSPASRRLALAVSQGGEFAFVLLTNAVAQNVISEPVSEFVSVVVTLSMVATPVLLLLDDWLWPKAPAGSGEFDSMPDEQGHVIIAGFGRFGQIVARILRARRIPFTALDASVEQIDFVAQYGNKIYYGDATNPAVLDAAQVGHARAVVLAIDNVEDSIKTASFLRARYPHIPIFARARDRRHTHQLMDMGITRIYRETYYTALTITGDLLQGLGLSSREADSLIETFKRHDEKRLFDDYSHFTDSEKLRARARRSAEELEELFAQDLEQLRNAEQPGETERTRETVKAGSA
ncbi:MAG: monovalent cation:proton antiporter-2 (CPA2) family protein [Dichotomicrobium sp.]